MASKAWLAVCSLIVLLAVASPYLHASMIRPRMLAAIPQLSDISVVDWTFRMRDASTGRGIPDVHITVRCTFGFGLVTTDEAYTDMNGYAYLSTPQCSDTLVTAEHPQYEARSATLDTLVSAPVNYLTLDWSLTPRASPPPGLVKATLYAQYDAKPYYVTGVAYIGGSSYGLQAGQPYARAVLWLAKSTSYILTVEGTYMETGTWLNPKSYRHTVQLTTGDQDAEYWLDLLSGELHGGRPPETPEDLVTLLRNALAWIGRNWMWVAAGGVALYVLPYATRIYEASRRK
ncbi:MAG: hypothetical protein QXD04_03555 [Candidatus Bathyarchaeia archaeon]